MIRLGLKDRSFAVALAGVAGYVDTVGFLKAGGFFVSFMSGNSTRLAVGLVRGSPSAGVAAGLIAAFVVGVMLGTVVSGSDMRSRRILLLVAALLAFAATVDQFGFGFLSIFVAAAAMGVENVAFARDGEVQIGLTYMTGTLVKLAQRLVQALRGHRNTGWLSFLVLWASLVGGGVVGAIIFVYLGFSALWLAVVILFGLSFYKPNVPSPKSQPMRS